jgi:hypothetical protein
MFNRGIFSCIIGSQLIHPSCGRYLLSPDYLGESLLELLTTLYLLYLFNPAGLTKDSTPSRFFVRLTPDFRSECIRELLTAR